VLTTSDSAVLRLMVESAANREVAKALFVSPVSVERNRKNLPAYACRSPPGVDSGYSA